MNINIDVVPMEAEINYVYLLQEREFRKTGENIYKIGKTKQRNLLRFKGYPKDSLIIYLSMCEDCDAIEKNIILAFKNSFVQKKDIGTEYFEGDYLEMIDVINSVVKDYGDAKNKTADKYKKMCATLAGIFPDYQNDMAFGGSAKYVRIVDGDADDLFVEYINDYYENYDGTPEGFRTYVVIRKYVERSGYLRFLLNKNILQKETAYDIRSAELIKMLATYKLSIYDEDFMMSRYYRYITRDIYGVDKVIHEVLECNLQVNGNYMLANIAPSQSQITESGLSKHILDGDETFNLRNLIDFNLITPITRSCYKDKKKSIFEDLDRFIKIGKEIYKVGYFIRYFPDKVEYNDVGEYWLLDPFREGRGNTNKQSGSFYTHARVRSDAANGYISRIYNCNHMIKLLGLTKCLNPNDLFTRCMAIVNSDDNMAK